MPGDRTKGGERPILGLLSLTTLFGLLTRDFGTPRLGPRLNPLTALFLPMGPSPSAPPFRDLASFGVSSFAGELDPLRTPTLDLLADERGVILPLLAGSFAGVTSCALTRGDSNGARAATRGAAGLAVVGVAVDVVVALPAMRGVRGVLEVAVLVEASVGFNGRLLRSVDIVGHHHRLHSLPHWRLKRRRRALPPSERWS